MTNLVRMVREDGAVADVRPEWIEEWAGQGWAVDGDEKPKAARKPKAAAPAAEAIPAAPTTGAADEFSDAQLRAMIQQETGEKVHHRTGRAKLVERFNALNESAAQE